MAHPDRAIAEAHIICLPKDGAPHAHHRTTRLAPLWSEFAFLLKAYAITKGTPAPLDARDADIARLKAEIAPGRRRGRQDAALVRAASAAAPPHTATQAAAPERHGAAPPQMTLDIDTGTLFSPPPLRKAPAPKLDDSPASTGEIPQSKPAEPAPRPVQMTMAELLRSYGHVKE